MRESVIEKLDIYPRCFDFSKAVVNLSKEVDLVMIYRPMMMQLVKAATSISANMMEASESESRKDFVGKLSIALKETKETLYWLRLLQETGLIGDKSNVLFTECGEIVKILASIKRKVSAS